MTSRRHCSLLPKGQMRLRTLSRVAQPGSGSSSTCADSETSPGKSPSCYLHSSHIRTTIPLLSITATLHPKSRMLKCKAAASAQPLQALSLSVHLQGWNSTWPLCSKVPGSCGSATSKSSLLARLRKAAVTPRRQPAHTCLGQFLLGKCRPNTQILTLAVWTPVNSQVC